MLKAGTDKIERWILVTGVIRSGTTFAGKILSLPWEVDYLHEPFNGGYRLPNKEPFQPRYVRPKPNGEEAQRYREHLAPLFDYNFGLHTAQHERDPWYKKAVKTLVGSRGPLYLRLAKINPLHRVALIKDPTGKLPAEYLYHQFGVRPVIVMRHPVSLAASLRRMEWWPDLRGFADEPHLAEDYFPDDEDFLNREWPTPLMRAMAHWRASYKMLLAQAQKHSGWQVVTHEALSQHPVKTFARLYDALGLPWSERVARRVRKMTGSGNSAEASSNQAMDLQRNSARIFEIRRDAIPKEERRAIFDLVEDVALQVYSRDSFAID